MSPKQVLHLRANDLRIVDTLLTSFPHFLRIQGILPRRLEKAENGPHGAHA